VAVIALGQVFRTLVVGQAPHGMFESEGALASVSELSCRQRNRSVLRLLEVFSAIPVVQGSEVMETAVQNSAMEAA
jgi:hypothetical protein